MKLLLFALILGTSMAAFSNTKESKPIPCAVISVHKETHADCRAYVAHFTQLSAGNEGDTGMDECFYLWLPSSSEFHPLCNEKYQKEFKRFREKVTEVIVSPHTQDMHEIADGPGLYIEYKIKQVQRTLSFNNKKCSSPETCKDIYKQFP